MTKIRGISTLIRALADLWINKCLKDRLTTIRTVNAIGRTKSDTNSRK